jgi:uncharacterized protein (DUF2336 family)
MDEWGVRLRAMSEYAETLGLSQARATAQSLGLAADGGSAPLRKSKDISADSFRKLTSLLKKTVVVPPIAPEPTPIIVAPHVNLPPIKPAPEFKPVPVVVETQPLELVVETPIEPEPEVVAEPQREPLHAAVVETPVRSKPSRETPRDAFALPPSKIPSSSPIIAVAQTPEQEIESAELARSLLDMMASSNSTGLPQERALASDTLLRMLPKLPFKSLVMLSERLCMMDAPPQLIVAKLISDPRIEVSGPLLENCMHITDEVLIGVIHEGSSDKRRMLARRRKISRAVAAGLIQTQEPSVLLTLVRNVNAEIAHESFIDLVNFAADHAEILAPLCTRPDLPVPFAFELFWLSPAQLRRYLLSRFLTDSETLTKILKIARDDSSENGAAIAFPDPQQIKNALALVAESKVEEGATLLAEAINIDPATAEKIVMDRQGDALAAVLKVAGVPRAIASEILSEAVQSILDPARDPDELQSLFDSLSFNKARILLTYWDWATMKSGPYAPLN